MNYNNPPKIERHLLLDCSLSYEVVKQQKLWNSLKEYEASFIAPPKCTVLADYISRAIKGFELIQTKEQLKLVTLDLFKQLKADHVIYAEIRFAPLLHTLKGLTPGQVVDTVNAAVGEGIKTYNIEAGIILCTLRHYIEAQSMATVNLENNYKGKHVVGFDIAADNSGFPIDNNIKAFKFTKDNTINCTAKAGEVKGSKSVWKTLKHFGPQRIGHGVRSTEYNKLLTLLKQENIHLEVCPTSNIQVDVYDKIENHTIDLIFKSGVSMRINTDARTISNITLAKEYKLLQEHFKTCNLEAITHSFASNSVKDKIKLQIENAY